MKQTSPFPLLPKTSDSTRMFAKIRKSSFFPPSLLLLAYLLLRILFQQIPDLKTLFIYPTGVLVSVFFGTGEYTGSEWIYPFDQTQFVLGESCSGTTFFSLLSAYLIYAKAKHKTRLIWLWLAYPATVLANTMRVLSSIYAYGMLTQLNAQAYGDAIHAITGSVTFLTCLLATALFVERTGKHSNHAKANSSI